MKILVIGDTHIKDSAINELRDIFDEIMTIKADKVIQLGDFYDHNKPTPLELLFGTYIAQELLRKYKSVNIISGTAGHDLLGDVSVVEYLKHTGIETIKGNYEFDNMLFGHWMTHESRKAYGTGRVSAKELKKYKYVFLGHDHIYQKLAKNVYHTGAVRYCNFGEVEAKDRRVALVDTEKDTLEWIKLKSPIPMKDFTSMKEIINVKDKNIKARLIISSFEQLKKEVNQIPKWKDKFVEFKVKYDIKREQIVHKLETNNKKTKLEDVLNEGIKKIQDRDVRELLEEIK